MRCVFFGLLLSSNLSGKKEKCLIVKDSQLNPTSRLKCEPFPTHTLSSMNLLKILMFLAFLHIGLLHCKIILYGVRFKSKKKSHYLNNKMYISNKIFNTFGGIVGLLTSEGNPWSSFFRVYLVMVDLTILYCRTKMMRKC